MQAPQDNWKTLLVIVVGLLVLHFLFTVDWLLYAALGVGLAAVLFPALGRLIVRGWMAVGQVLGRINGSILLSLVFFILLFPIAVLYRLFNKDSLRLKNEYDSLFTERNHSYQKEDLENVW